MGNPDLQTQRRQLQDSITSLESRLRRRLAGKIKARGSFDVDDVLNSARRRLDEMVSVGGLPVQVGNLYPFLCGVAKNIALEKFRKQNRQARLEAFICRKDPPSLEAGPDDERGCGGLLTQLEPAERQLIDLWLRGLSLKQIAEVVGTDAECVKTRRRRILARLRGLSPNI